MARWFCEAFHPDTVNFETLTPSRETEAAKLSPPDPYRFARNCVKSWRVLREHDVAAGYAPVSLDRAQTTSCPVGRDVLILHPDGMLASCYLLENDWIGRGMDLSVGKLHESRVDIDREKVLRLRKAYLLLLIMKKKKITVVKNYKK